MAEVEPRKPIIIKLYLPRNNSAKRGPSPSDINDDSRGDEKRMKKKIKVDIDDSSSSSSSSSKPTTTCSKTSSVSAVGKSKTCNCGTVKEYSRTVSEEQQRRPQQQQLIIKEDNTVDDVVEYSRGNKKKTKTESFVKENSRGASTTTGSEKKKKMERYKKNQCWVILKRMMIGRDGWALKHPLDDNNYSDHHNMLIRPMGLEEIERKLKKWEYSGADEFAEDVRLVFSHALLRCPPRSEVHRIAMRLGDSFEISWKSLKEKWSLHELKEQRKLRKKELVLCTPPPHDDDDDRQQQAAFERGKKTTQSMRGSSRKGCASLKEHNFYAKGSICAGH